MEAERVEEKAVVWGPKGAFRLTVGLLQGVALYGLVEAVGPWSWSDDHPIVFVSLVLVCAFAPLILLAGAESMRRSTLAIWTLAAAAALAGLGAYDAWRAIGGTAPEGPSPQAFAFGAAGLFIAHHLVAGSEQDRRIVASYPTYFDIAWKNGVQLALSIAFTGVFWALLFLGATLFGLINIGVFGEIIREPWFFFPATGLVFALAVHITDVRAGMVRGVRTLALTLLSWLLPVLALIAVVFLIALMATGLEPLWATRSAASIILSAAAGLVVLINAAYQDGVSAQQPRWSRYAATAASFALVPLVGIAAYALWLRIGQHGLTPERIVACACVAIGALYALGYAVAAVWPGRAFRRLEIVNVIAAVGAVAVIASLLSPLADPARLSVADQLRRLEGGRISMDSFDWEFLRWRGARYGREALRNLARSSQATIAARAREAVEQQERHTATPESVARRVNVFPAGRTLPADFVRYAEDELRQCAYGNSTSCDARFADIDGDDSEELLLLTGWRTTAYERSSGRWTVVGRFHACEAMRAALRAGDVAETPSTESNLRIGDQIAPRQPDFVC
jgi:hypothetical protein